MSAPAVLYSAVPRDEAELCEFLKDPMWRVCSGFLYKIMVKSVGDDEGAGVIPFKPNRAQRRLLSRLHHRNIILKARQLGFTTLVAIMWLDHALFNTDQRCGIIAQDREAAEYIFRDKVKLAYERLPDMLRNLMPLARDSASELLFAHNNSSIRVGTSMRSGTIHRLHVSEFGKICAMSPIKASEVVTGSLPAVPLDGICIIESTAEGQDGDFYKMTMRAMKQADEGLDAVLSERDYRFHFFPWWQDEHYSIAGQNIVITDKDHIYFDQIEAVMATKLERAQRNWYIATRDADFSGDHEKMWQEYPSTPLEAFQVSTEGKYYAVQMAKLRKDGRIGFRPMLDGVAVNSFWDIGSGDGTGVWLHQHIDGEDRFFKYIEGWGEPYSYFVKQMVELKCIWGVHYLPHDADHKRQQGDQVLAPKDMLEKLPIAGTWETVPRVTDLTAGIQLTRSAFSTYTFDKEGCKQGLHHLDNYSKEWNPRQGCWSSHPKKDIHTEAADALRQHAQGFKPGDGYGRIKPQQRNWRTA